MSLFRHKLEYLGSVTAPDQRSAEAAAVTEFKLSEAQRKRLVIRREQE